MTEKLYHVAWVGILGKPQWAARNGYFPNGRCAVRWVASRAEAGAFDRQEARRIRPELGQHDRLVIVPASQAIPPIKNSMGRLVFEAIRGGTPGPHGEYCITPARYAKGKVIISCPGWHEMKTRAARLAVALGGRWAKRSGGYTVGPRTAERFVQLYAEGRDASIFGALE
jgi:hypothetical protein